MNKSLSVIYLIILMFYLSGCSDSASDDSAVSAYKNTVHKVLTVHCDGGVCHSSGANAFAAQDVYDAYPLVAQNNWINIESPTQSSFVTRISATHGTWSGDVEGDADVVQYSIDTFLDELPDRFKSNSISLSDDINAFENSLYALITQYCGACHTRGNQFPGFADGSIAASYDILFTQGLVDLNSPESSQLVGRVQIDGHQCWSGDCQADGQRLADEIRNWASTNVQ